MRPCTCLEEDAKIGFPFKTGQKKNYNLFFTLLNSPFSLPNNEAGERS